MQAGRRRTSVSDVRLAPSVRLTDAFISCGAVAVFHASFHPTKGNVIDWCERLDDGIDLAHVEFSCLPSGLHAIDEDVVYFTKGPHHGVCVFRRRHTAAHGHRGVRLSSLGVLLARAERPRPWRHVPALKALARAIYAALEAREGEGEPTPADWAPASSFFRERRARAADRCAAGEGTWAGWARELGLGAAPRAGVGEDGDTDPGCSAPRQPDAYDPSPSPEPNPTLHLPALLRALGPSALTLYKHVLGRRRVLVYTRPPVEAACVLCRVVADVCWGAGVGQELTAEYRDEDEDEDEGGGYHDDEEGGGYHDEEDGEARRRKGKGQGKGKAESRANEGIPVLGMVTLSDLARLDAASGAGRGWVACTTDAILLERPEGWDLVVDLTAGALGGGKGSGRGSRPALSMSRVFEGGQGRKRGWRLETVRFTWSDVRLWNELDRILQEDASSDADAPPPPSLGLGLGAPPAASSSSAASSSWPSVDVWRLYEDACVLCAGLWLAPYADASPPDDAYVDEDDPDLVLVPSQAHAHAHAHAQDAHRRLRARRIATTRALLRALHAHTEAFVGRLAGVLPPVPPDPQPRTRDVRTANASTGANTSAHPNSHHLTHMGSSQGTGPAAPAPVDVEIILTPRDLLALSLGPLSALDARFVEWVAGEYYRNAGGEGQEEGEGAGRVRVVVRRGWREVLGLVLGLG
ncbi:hypothetical protein EIP86_008194 [Pleurotus ostreatoroseus]|nr:hypothetical protein EIP86_008194 [Pleurotus ostreatoroseus]